LHRGAGREGPRGRAPAAVLPACTGAPAARRAGAGCGAGAACLRRGCWGLEAGRWRGAQVLGGGRRRGPANARAPAAKIANDFRQGMSSHF